jgi:hypothetical protein
MTYRELLDCVRDQERAFRCNTCGYMLYAYHFSFVRKGGRCDMCGLIGDAIREAIEHDAEVEQHRATIRVAHNESKGP